jgi:hypothetical protein
MLPGKIKRCLLIFFVFIVGIVVFLIRNPCSDKDGGCDDLREKVGFPHEQHMGLYDCQECHHVYDDWKNNVLDPADLYDGNPDIKCLSCHGPEAAINGMTAFHRQCMGCHNREAAAGQASGPNMCSECHCRDGIIPTEYEMVIGD